MVKSYQQTVMEANEIIDEKFREGKSVNVITFLISKKFGLGMGFVCRRIQLLQDLEMELGTSPIPEVVKNDGE